MITRPSPWAHRVAAIATAVLPLALSPNAAHAEALPKVGNNGERLVWQRDEVAVCIDDAANAIQDLPQHLRTAFLTWAAVPSIPTFELWRDRCDVVITLSDNLAGRDDALAICGLAYASTTGLARATITINPRYFESIGDATVDPSAYDLPSILAHELGHALGLEDDLDDATATMYGTTSRGDVAQRTLAEGDVDAITAQYLIR